MSRRGDVALRLGDTAMCAPGVSSSQPENHLRAAEEKEGGGGGGGGQKEEEARRSRAATLLFSERRCYAPLPGARCPGLSMQSGQVRSGSGE